MLIKHLPGPEPSSEQLFSNYYIKKVSVPWEPWMDEEEKEEDADDEEKSKDAGGQPTAQQSPEPPPKRRRLTDADADADTAEKQPSREKEIADAEMAEAILPEQCDPQQQQQPQNLAAQRKMVERDIFRMPVPKLAWELMPHQTAAKVRFSRSQNFAKPLSPKNLPSD